MHGRAFTDEKRMGILRKKQRIISVVILAVVLFSAGGGLAWLQGHGEYYDMRTEEEQYLIRYFQDVHVLPERHWGGFHPDQSLISTDLITWRNALAEHRGYEKIAQQKENTSLSLSEAVAVLSMKHGEYRLTLGEAKRILDRRHMPVEENGLLTRRQGLQLLRAMDTALGHPDVLVYGSELESVSAAVTAADEGMEVLLLHEKPDIGGLLVDGKLNYLDIPMSDGEWLIQGFAQRFYDEVGNSFAFETARTWMKDQLQHAGVVVRGATGPLKTKVNDGTITAVTDGRHRYTMAYVIDASENGDLMAVSGASFSKGLEALGRPVYPGVSLIYELGGVDFPKVCKTLQDRAQQGDPTVGATDEVAWGYQEEMKGYQPQQESILVRGLGIAYLKNENRVVINHLIDTDIDPLNPASIAASKQRMQEELTYLVPYLQKHLPGFEHAYLYETARDLYLRDSRHFQGSHILSLADVLKRKTFKDQVLITNYPLDLHAAKDIDRNLVIHYGQSYYIPYGVLHDDRHDNLLVSSKCASYDPLAASSTRIVMTGTMMSEIAGHAVALAWRDGQAVQDILIPDLRQVLQSKGFRMHHPAPLKEQVPDRLIELLSDGRHDIKEVRAILAEEK